RSAGGNAHPGEATRAAAPRVPARLRRRDAPRSVGRSRPSRRPARPPQSGHRPPPRAVARTLVGSRSASVGLPRQGAGTPLFLVRSPAAASSLGSSRKSWSGSFGGAAPVPPLERLLRAAVQAQGKRLSLLVEASLSAMTV